MEAMKVQRKMCLVRRKVRGEVREQVRELILIRFLYKPSGKDGHGDIHTTEIKRKTYILRFKFDFCEITTKIALKNGLNIDLGNILFVYLRDVKLNDPDKKIKIDKNIILFDYGS